MKKLLLGILLIVSASFAGRECFSGVYTQVGTANPVAVSGYRTIEGYNFLQLTIPGVSVVTSSNIIIYADNIAGYTKLDFYGYEVSTGSVATTMDCQALYSTGQTLNIAAQVLTSGTDITALKSAKYRLKIFDYKTTSNRTVSFNVLISR